MSNFKSILLAIAVIIALAIAGCGGRSKPLPTVPPGHDPGPGISEYCKGLKAWVVPDESCEYCHHVWDPDRP